MEQQPLADDIGAPAGEKQPAAPRSFQPAPLALPSALVWAAAGVIAFHVAYGSFGLGFLILLYQLCLFRLAFVATARQAFYLGLGTGLLTAAPQLTCFWSIFGISAVALWLVVAFWIGLFVALARLCLARFGNFRGALLVPFLWTGLEYFRSELYFLRFSWLSVGYAFAGSPQVFSATHMGMYGVGWVLMLLAASLSLLPARRAGLWGGAGLVPLAGVGHFPPRPKA